MKILQFILLASLACLAGCEPTSSTVDVSSGDGNDSVASTESTPTGNDSSDAGDAQASEVELTVLAWDAIASEIAASGKPTVVDIWSTQCVPCMQEFHGLVELNNEFGDKIRCVSVNIDFIGGKSNPPESYREEVLSFLQSQKATFSNFLSATPDTDVYDKLQLQSIPAVIVYNADGTVARRFVDEADSAVSYEKAIKPFVRKLAETL